MIVRHATALGGLALALIAAPAHAGPCTQEIYDADIAVGKRLDAIAAAGKTAPQSTFATTHHQPTPSSVAGAEEKLGGIPETEVHDLAQGMEEARKADAAGDLAACQKALADLRRLLGR